MVYKEATITKLLEIDFTFSCEYFHVKLNLFGKHRT